MLKYHTCIKFCGLIFRVFDWQENSWGINFHGHGAVVVTIIVRFAKYASYFHEIHKKFIHLKISMRTVVYPNR